MVDGRGTGSLVSLTGWTNAHTHTDRLTDSTDRTDRLHMAMLQDVHAVAGLTPRTAYLFHTQDAAPSPRTVLYFQGPMLPALPTDLADEQHALRLIYICPQPASACIGPSFPLPKYWSTFGLRIPKLSRISHPQGQTPPASVSSCCCCAALLLDRLVRAAALDGSPPLPDLYLVP